MFHDQTKLMMIGSMLTCLVRSLDWPLTRTSRTRVLALLVINFLLIVSVARASPSYVIRHEVSGSVPDYGMIMTGPTSASHDELFPLPTGPVDGGKFAQINGFAINKASPYPEIAWDWVVSLITDPEFQVRAFDYGGISAMTQLSLRHVEGFADSLIGDPIRAMTLNPHIRLEPMFAQALEVMMSVQHFIEKMSFDPDWSLGRGALELEEDVNRILSEHRE